MMKKAVSKTIVAWDNRYSPELIELAKKLSPYLPNNAVLALDCVPRNGEINAFHYVDGRSDIQTPLHLQGETRYIDDILCKTKRFHINYEAGVAVGLWTQLSFANYESQVNWNEAFVIKKATGEMVFYDPILIAQKTKKKIDSNAFRSRGVSTKIGIINFLCQPGANFYQKYHEPLCGPQEPYRLATYRMLLLVEKGSEIKILCGLWTSTPANSIRLKDVNDVRIGLIRI
jgi:hypothetical protein